MKDKPGPQLSGTLPNCGSSSTQTPTWHHYYQPPPPPPGTEWLLSHKLQVVCVSHKEPEKPSALLLPIQMPAIPSTHLVDLPLGYFLAVSSRECLCFAVLFLSQDGIFMPLVVDPSALLISVTDRYPHVARPHRQVAQQIGMSYSTLCARHE